MTSVERLWNEFDAAKVRIGQVFAEPTGLFDHLDEISPERDEKIVRLHDARRKPSRKRARKSRKSKKA